MQLMLQCVQLMYSVSVYDNKWWWWCNSVDWGVSVVCRTTRAPATPSVSPLRPLPHPTGGGFPLAGVPRGGVRADYQILSSSGVALVLYAQVVVGVLRLRLMTAVVVLLEERLCVLGLGVSVLQKLLTHLGLGPADTATRSLLDAAQVAVLTQPGERRAEEVGVIRAPGEQRLGRRAELDVAHLGGEVGEAVKDVSGVCGCQLSLTISKLTHTGSSHHASPTR